MPSSYASESPPASVKEAGVKCTVPGSGAGVVFCATDGFVPTKARNKATLLATMQRGRRSVMRVAEVGERA
jgi:hypothetical protein